MNEKLLRKVQADFIAHPEKCNMSFFADETPCGTVVCIAGDTLLLAGYKLTESVSLGKKVLRFKDSNGLVNDEADVAAELLGLDEQEAWSLFYVTNWPRKFHERYVNAKTPAEIAQVVSDRIDSFIANYGELERFVERLPE